MAENIRPPVVPMQVQGAGLPLKPHRGVVVLVLGILGIVVCFICGIIAWVMGNNDLREMNAGLMDPSGRGMTRAGKICGIVGVVINIVVLGMCLIGLVIMVGLIGVRMAPR